MHNRAQILIVGPRSINHRAFESRRLVVRKMPQIEDLTEAVLNEACGIVLADQPGRFRLATEFFNGPFRRACELGLSTGVYADDPNDHRQLATLWSSGNVIKAAHPGAVWVRLGESLEDIAEVLARHAPGPKAGDAVIVPLDPALEVTPGTEMLLRRAFADSKKLVIEELRGGKSAKETFRVFASLKSRERGPQPMPFFVKIGSPTAIEAEKANYHVRAEPFIPFHLRPALNIHRSVTTSTLAALVCNFVESAVPLRTAWRDGTGAGTIFSLFEVTLRGLRAHTTLAPEQAGVLAAFAKERVRVHEILAVPEGAERLREAHHWKLKRTPEDTERQLIAVATPIAARRGLYHGDLHCGNVMVRGRDAIVIDFGSMGDEGPITADPAFLEVSLVFGADEKDAGTSFDEWREFVDELYLRYSPIEPPVHDVEHFRYAWLRKAVRELRHIGRCCGSSADEVRIVLAACLLRFARLSASEFSSPALVNLSERRRAYALVVADRICSDLIDGHGARAAN